MQRTLVVLVEAEVVVAIVGNMNIVEIAKIVDLTAAQFLFLLYSSSLSYSLFETV